MLIYNIIPINGFPNVKKEIIGAEVHDVETLEYACEDHIMHNKKFMINRYGFQLNKFELDQFLTHKSIWNLFEKTSLPYCLIIESGALLTPVFERQLSQLEKLLENGGAWDVFFPFERKIPDKQSEMEYGYLLGCYWGLDAYFISRAGIKKLLTIEKIRYPLDEEMLILCSKDKLEIGYQQIEGVEFCDYLEQKIQRNRSVLEAIFRSKALSLKDWRLAKNILKKISKVGRDLNIDLFLCYGSLLGKVRHDGIMDWDDDVDLAMGQNRHKELILSINEVPGLSASIFYWGAKKAPHIKIWSDEGKPIDRFSYKFPFIDIWFYNEIDGHIVFNIGDSYPKQKFLPGSITTFEGSTFKLPQDPLSCLDITYSNWRTAIQVYTYCHRLERNKFFPLIARIDVDDYGRYHCRSS